MGKDLFSYHGDQLREAQAPLADRMRPRTLDEFEGQDGILAQGRLLRRAIAADRIGNLLLHGPPGVGKTTLARIIAGHTRAHFTNLNAVLAGVKDIRQEVESAQNRLNRYQLRTILFIDEVHRFNSAQQDALLPWVENGTLSLIGATTENPFFEVNKALVSRSRIFRLQQLNTNDLNRLLIRALKDEERGYGKLSVSLEEEAANHLVDVANGDARSLLNALELAVETTLPDDNGIIHINLQIAEESIQERAILYDKQGDAHFDTISAFIKSLRGSDPDAALFWLARMVEAGENPRFIFRRMLIAAAEDIGLADPQAIVVVESCAASFERIGLPEGLYLLAQAALYLASAEKSNSIKGFFHALSIVRDSKHQEIPNHLRDSHRDKEEFGDGKGYKYPHDFPKNWVPQQYLPSGLQGEIFWEPGHNGWEGELRQKILDRRVSQLAAVNELAEDYPLVFSHSPENSDFDRWFQRQLNQQNGRLNVLRERLWSGVLWQHCQRVLVIGGRSLIWAVDPLRKVPDGGVTILCETVKEKTRLSAQIDLLDSTLQPRLITKENGELKQLTNKDQFEWVGGRLSIEEVNSADISIFCQLVSRQCVKNAGLRLLISSPLIGPAAGLNSLLSAENSSDDEHSLLLTIIRKEESWIQQNTHNLILTNELEANGWELQWEEWEENISLQFNSSIEQRWLGDNRPYRCLVLESFSQAQIEEIRKIIKRFYGKYFTQNLLHRRLIGVKKLP